eukprot:GFKZ01001032.1.p1 GENE.GFKZ01001032.1~~GFKZ01001032.1.p1  ORF type:complete len:445 (+),score=54.03 GFKZ01001032.1:1324-2658(+)
MQFPTPVQTVAIIGAGASGLVTATNLRSAGFKPTVFEALPHVGGTWSYSPTPSPYSSMYASLRCNIPSIIMPYRSHPFSPDTPSFAKHNEVFGYLRQYAQKTGILDCIQFNAKVASVVKSAQGWQVEVESGSEVHGGLFDAVVVAVGQYSVPDPWVPEGTELFYGPAGRRRSVDHSHVYKTPQRYAGRDVLIIGAGPSGIDIGLEIARVARKVYVSHKAWTDGRFLGRAKEVPKVRRVVGEGAVLLEDGRRVEVDDILLCTGYLYKYPFLEEGLAGVRVIERGKAVEGLMGHLLAKKDPTLAFVGLPWRIIPFPLFEDQAKFLVKVWRNQGDPGRVQDWVEAEERDWEIGLQGEPRFLHCLGARQWEYRRRLASVSGAGMPEDMVVEVTNDSSNARSKNAPGYRRRDYVAYGKGSGEWRVLLDGVDVTGADPATFAEPEVSVKR